jgi:hypothetical protein
MSSLKLTEKTRPSFIQVYDTSYGSEIPAEQYFVVNFDSIVSKYSDSTHYCQSIIKYFESIGFEKHSLISTVNRREDKVSNALFVNEKLRMMIKIDNQMGDSVWSFNSFFSPKKIETNKKNDDLVQVTFLYDIKLGSLDKQINLKKISEFKRDKKKSSISLVKSDMGHLDVEDYDLTIPPMDLGLNYGEEFIKIHDLIVSRLNKPNGKGIILLHGEPGTGKTSYIKHLTSLIEEKNILFIPPSMAEMLSEPSIIPFLMSHKNSILIIEDAERVIADREGNGSAVGVSNILNITDGILGDCLNIQIIATFNMKREKIDPALLRKGRLIAEHKFEKLSVENTNKLLKHLEKDYTSTEEMALADIYNVDVEFYKTNNKSKIGF